MKKIVALFILFSFLFAESEYNGNIYHADSISEGSVESAWMGRSGGNKWNRDDEDWFKFTASTTGTYSLSFTNYVNQAAISVYSGPTYSPTLVAGGSSSVDGDDITFSFSASSGTTYYIQIEATNNIISAPYPKYEYDLSVAPSPNNPPVITSGNSFSVAENTTSVGNITATDADGDTLTYSIIGGSDSAKFSINASTGALSFSSAPDYETPTDSDTNNVYVVEVQVSDGTDTVSDTISVTVTDIAESGNNPPVITSGNSFSVAENTTSVGNITATDADGDTLTYSIIGGSDSAKFSINASTGALSFSSAPDYETPTDSDTNNVYVVEVQVSDGTDTVSDTISVTVTDISEGALPDETIPTVTVSTVTPVCDTFEDVLQTRNSGSEIVHKSGANATISGNRDLFLNTSNVDFGSWNHLYCDGGDCSQSGDYGESLSVSYSNVPETTTINNTPSSVVSTTTITTNPNNFSNQEYGEIETSWAGTYPYDLDFNINGLLKVNSFDLQPNSTDINFSSSAQYSIDIGTISNTSTFHKIYTDSNAKNIKINTLSLAGGVDINLSASQTIQFETLSFGRDNSSVVLKAPYVVINSLTMTNSGSNSSNMIIYADIIDISTLDLQEQATLTIKPFTVGGDVIFRTNSITESSSSTILMSSGSYYTSTLSLPGSSSVCSMKAIDNTQMINLFIDGDLDPGNNPGINADGSSGNYGTLNPANFMLFINGDLTTGGGGTTFNATVYVEGSVDFGSPTYLKGAISSGGSISIGNSSEFIFDQSNVDSSGFGLCSGLDDEFVYQCGIFQSALSTYERLDVNNNNLVINIPLVVADTLNGTIDCETGGITTTCSRQDPPVNTLSLPTFKDTTVSSLTTVSSSTTVVGGEVGDYAINTANVKLTFEANETYNNSNTNVMRIGDISLGNKNGVTIEFKEGDYWIQSMDLDGNDLTIDVDGSVRLFIKDDFYVNTNNMYVNSGGDAKNLQIYVYSDINLANSGSANYDFVAYLYAKGNIDIAANANSGTRFKGALTSEGNITISNNQDFEYDSQGLEEIGGMNCYVCYSTDDSHGFVYNAGFMFGNINVPIVNRSGFDLSNATVTQTYQSSFSMTFFGSYAVKDQDGNVVGTATKNSSTDYSMYSSDMVMSFDTTSISYDFGTVPLYDGINYKSAYESYLFSFSFSPSDWKNNAVFLIEYDDDKNRTYRTVLEACEFEEYDYSYGQFDAWDIDKNINDRNITTKIVNKDFNLTLVSLNNENNDTLIRSETVKYYLINNEDNSSITTKTDIDFSTYVEQNISFIVGSAYKNVSVAYDVCHLSSDTDANWTIYDYLECFGGNATLKLGTIISRDNFAIRPNEFNISYSANVAYAGEGFNVEFNALDYNNTATNLYDEAKNSSFKVEMSDLNSSCEYGAFVSDDFNFSNGYVSISGYYTGIGDINISIYEISGAEFAIVDADDTADEDRFITSFESNITVYPYNINIENVSLSSQNGNYVYSISDGNLTEMNISVDVNMTIQDMFGNILIDFNSSCGFDFNSSFVYYINNRENIDTVSYSGTVDDGNNSISDLNKTVVFVKEIFSNGEGIGSYSFNIDKNISTPHKPVELNLTAVVLSSNAKVNDSLSLNQSLSIYYGRIKVTDVKTENDEVNITIYYEVYDPENKLSSFETDEENRYWKIVSTHNSIDGNVTGSYVDSATIGVNLYDTAGGEQNLSVKYSGTSKPYKTKVHLDSKSWLWTSLFEENYQAPSSANKDCLTHYCVNVTFVGGNIGWIGVSANTTNKEDRNASKRTADINVTTPKKEGKKEFIKIIW